MKLSVEVTCQKCKLQWGDLLDVTAHVHRVVCPHCQTEYEIGLDFGWTYTASVEYDDEVLK